MDKDKGQLTEQKLNGNKVALPGYDTASGVMTSVSYPSGAGNVGNGTSGTFGFDTRGRPKRACR